MVGQPDNQPRGVVFRTYLDAAKWLALGSAMLLSLLAAILPLAGFSGMLSYAVAGLAVVVGFAAIGLVIAARRPMLETAVLAVFLAVAGLLFTINVAVTAGKSKAATDATAKAMAKENELRKEEAKSSAGQKATAEMPPKAEGDGSAAKILAAEWAKIEDAKAKLAEQKAKDAETTKLEGTWKLLSEIDRGKNRLVDPKEVWIFGGDKLENKIGLTPADSFTVKIAADKSPKEIDLIPLQDPNKGVPCRAIYKVDGTTFTICVNFAAPKGERPSAFESSQDNRYILMTFKKQN
jgi:uncharacterized protein (TIGR03067 family)